VRIVKELMEIWPNEVCDNNVKEKVIRRQKRVEAVQCFKYGEEGHKYRECPERRKEKERQAKEIVMHMAMLQKT